MVMDSLRLQAARVARRGGHAFAGVPRSAWFWLLQLGGWTGYGLSKLLAFPMTFADSLWVIAKGVLLTCGLRALYRRLERHALPLPATIAIAMLASLLVGKLSLELSHWASLQGIVFPAPGAAAWLRTWDAVLHEFMVLMSWSALYLGIGYAMDLHREKDRLQEALADAQHARTQMLRYQLNPHFLFNALASLRASVAEDPPRAQAMINDLSGYLRYSLLGGGEDEVTLEREFEAIRHYLAIQKVRFEERIDYEVALDGSVAQLRLPAFLIQPLVENAVKYGMRTSEGVASIRVRGASEDDACVLTVENTGQWVDAASAMTDLDRSGIGLRNLQARLAEHFPRRHRFDIAHGDDGWVRARLQIDGVR
jgi:two-component system, LytTR family, sensor kinase